MTSDQIAGVLCFTCLLLGVGLGYLQGRISERKHQQDSRP